MTGRQAFPGLGEIMSGEYKRGAWGLMGLLAGGAGLALWWSSPSGNAGLKDRAARAAISSAGDAALPIRVKSIHPKLGKDLEVSVEQPAEVAPYYRVSLLAQVAGTVKYLEKEIGDKVSAGEKLIELDTVENDPRTLGKAILRAPFDGVVASRAVDPGAFVPSANIVPGAPALLVIEKTDIVTVSMQVPDGFAAYVGLDTPAEIRMDSFPGRALGCRLTRLAPSLNPSDRTLRVEVDLYNGTAQEHKAFLAKAQMNNFADLKNRKLPVFPEGMEANGAARLLPGMFGRMRLRLRQFQNIALVPSGAIIRLGGVPYLYRVEAGVARRARVSVEMDDGTLARVFWLEQADGKDVSRELNPAEEIIFSNQGELEDGSPVQPSLSEW